MSIKSGLNNLAAVQAFNDEDDDIIRPSRITFVPVADISEADFNPSSRTDPKKLKSLIESIRKARHYIINAVHLTSDFHLIDGHRRVAAARIIGLYKVPALVYAFDSQSPHFGELYTRINATARPFGPKEQLAVAGQGGTAFSAAHARIVEEINKTLSPKIIDRLEWRLTAYKEAKRAWTTFCQEAPYQLTLESVLEYMFDCRAQQNIKLYNTAWKKAENKKLYSAQRFYNAVTHKLPLF